MLTIIVYLVYRVFEVDQVFDEMVCGQIQKYAI